MATDRARTKNLKPRTLSGKRVLITAGPTWVSIDKVRVISNTASGETGILLAEKLKDSGAKVTLLLGPVESCCLDKKIKLIRFKFFEELEKLMRLELKRKKYDIIIHSAAVSDYKPLRYFNSKISSGLESWQLKLKATPKIIDSLKKLSPSSLVVGFKFEPKVNKQLLKKKAKKLLHRANLDIVVANSITDNHYLAYVIDKENISMELANKKVMSCKLIDIIGGCLCRN